jgi:N-sulfoglucosamine sulfohydrolase
MLTYWQNLLIAFLILGGSLLPTWLHAADARPNILFILTEDQGAHLSCLGTPGLQTPNMDALARSGVLFRNAFVAYPVCSASKAAIYTSLHNHANGILNITVNYHKPADQLTEAEKNNSLYRSNRIFPGIPTLVERLKEAGYYQGITYKLHVAPSEKFPYDEFLPNTKGDTVAGFIRRAAKTRKPWFLLYNINDTHRPFPNSDKVKIRVNPAEVKLPAFLPDTPIVRQDWAEYLAAIEKADDLVGEGMAALRASGQADNTIVICFGGDHGPTFQHGKMTLYDLGLRVTLSISGPGLPRGVVSDALVSELDMTPTLLDLLGLAPLPKSHGVSLRPVLEGRPGAKGHDFIFAEISNLGVLPNNGMQERSVCDGRWHLIYREKLQPAWRQVQADSKDWKPWGNRTYAETVRVKDQFPESYRILAEMDPQSLGGKVQALELYDLQTDPDEMHNLAGSTAARPQRDRLYAALRQWVRDTADPAVSPPPTPPGRKSKRGRS